MRYSEDHKGETHRRLVERAARVMRERGSLGVSIQKLMSSAGMTHGGFYTHFSSRDALVKESFVSAINEMIEKAS